jgi:stage V sporulation protein AE
LKRRVIVVTDGDNIAKEAVEIAATNIGGRCISASSGNPTSMSGKDIVRLILQAKYDPVIVMVDDRGNTGVGSGEKALHYIINDEEVEVMGVVAVASNSPKVRGVRVDFSVDKFGNVFPKAVDKDGNVKKDRLLKGDTVNSLADIDIPIVVGIGDPGKMSGYDTLLMGSPILTRALEIIIDNYNKNLHKFPQ